MRAVVVGLVVLLVGCTTWERVYIAPGASSAGHYVRVPPDPDAAACVAACARNMDCLSRCPGAAQGDGACPAKAEGVCVADADADPEDRHVVVEAGRCKDLPAIVGATHCRETSSSSKADADALAVTVLRLAADLAAPPPPVLPAPPPEPIQ